MPELKTDLIPLLPLNNGVVLPNMVVTVPLEREEAQAAVAAARSGDQLVLLVPRVEGRYASIGTVAKLEDSRTLPNGVEVAILQGQYRATVGSAAAGTGPALRVMAQPAAHVNPLSDTAHARAREYKALIENLLELRGAGEVVQMARDRDRLDSQFSGLDARHALAQAVRRPVRRGRGAPPPRPGPRRAGRRQGPDHRVSGCAQAA